MSEGPIRLTRSMLFVPGSRPDMLEKAARSAADSVCLDLEDSVALNQKESSRANVVHALQTLDFGPRVRMVRINALDTPFAYRDVIDVVETVGERLDLIMLPKTQHPRDVHFLDTLLSQIEAHKGIAHRIGIEAQIETAAGFLALREIASSVPRLEALVFGPADYAASMHMAQETAADVEEDRLLPVRHAIVAAAHAGGLRCMDGPFTGLQDPAGLLRACDRALALGFDGKQCIHPAQLDTVNRIFAPSPDQLEWARAVESAYEGAAEAGTGAISLDGKMIDAAHRRMAQAILERQHAIERREDGG